MRRKSGAKASGIISTALYRAVGKTGQIVDFLLTGRRDEQAAKRFLTKAIRRHGVPETIAIDAVRPMWRRPEAIPRSTAPQLCSARCAFAGVELMSRFKEGQTLIDEGEENLTPAKQCYALTA
jgi:hypothetical protein